MKVDLFKKRGIALTSSGIEFYDSYYLPDMAYGQYLVYDGLKPMYYLDALNDVYKDLSEYGRSNDIDVYSLMIKVLSNNREANLSVKEQCLLKFRFGKEKSEQLNIRKFPLSMWDEAKPLLR